jgi:hypothetical protein
MRFDVMHVILKLEVHTDEKITTYRSRIQD